MRIINAQIRLRMRRLVCASVVCTPPKTGFLATRPVCLMSLIYEMLFSSKTIQKICHISLFLRTVKTMKWYSHGILTCYIPHASFCPSQIVFNLVNAFPPTILSGSFWNFACELDVTLIFFYFNNGNNLWSFTFSQWWFCMMLCWIEIDCLLEKKSHHYFNLKLQSMKFGYFWHQRGEASVFVGVFFCRKNNSSFVCLFVVYIFVFSCCFQKIF